MRLRVLGLVFAAGALVPAGASADGLPVTGVDAGPTGVAGAGAVTRFVTLPARRDTVVAEVWRAGGKVDRSRIVRGRYTIPAVALDGSASGLSADLSTLVLISPRPRYPRERTSFAVLDAVWLRVREFITLRGDYSFDALSPNGRRLYLIEYTSRRDPTRYAVRAYDLREGRMLAEPIIDPLEPDERMRGFPLTRATSPDGRWEYTLYDGAGSHPFIHGLDTVAREAVCIDLDALEGRSLGGLKLEAGAGPRLEVVDGGTRVLFVDRETRRVTAPPGDVAPVDERLSGPVQVGLLTMLALVLLGTGAALRIGRRRRGDGRHWFPTR